MSNGTSGRPNRLSNESWRWIRERYDGAARAMAEAPAAWMGIPNWARWFRRIDAVRRRDRSLASGRAPRTDD